MTTRFAAPVIFAGMLVTQTAAAQEAIDENDVEQCPEAFRGVRLDVKQTHDGVTLDFYNPNRASVAEMREQVREVAELIERHSLQTQATGLHDEGDIPPV